MAHKGRNLNTLRGWSRPTGSGVEYLGGCVILPYSLRWWRNMACISVDRARIAEFCRRHHIRKLAFFGSVLREDFGPNSDVDVLVEFEPRHVPGLAFFAMEAELSQILGRKVDLNTSKFLSRYFRDQVLSEAETQYAAS